VICLTGKTRPYTMLINIDHIIRIDGQTRTGALGRQAIVSMTDDTVFRAKETVPEVERMIVAARVAGAHNAALGARECDA